MTQQTRNSTSSGARSEGSLSTFDSLGATRGAIRDQEIVAAGRRARRARGSASIAVPYLPFNGFAAMIAFRSSDPIALRSGLDRYILHLEARLKPISAFQTGGSQAAP
jgi:hypothetical protein